MTDAPRRPPTMLHCYIVTHNSNCTSLLKKSIKSNGLQHVLINACSVLLQLTDASTYVFCNYSTFHNRFESYRYGRVVCSFQLLTLPFKTPVFVRSRCPWCSTGFNLAVSPLYRSRLFRTCTQASLWPVCVRVPTCHLRPQRCSVCCGSPPTLRERSRSVGFGAVLPFVCFSVGWPNGPLCFGVSVSYCVQQQLCRLFVVVLTV